MKTLKATGAWILICSLAVVSTATRHPHHDGASRHGDSPERTPQDIIGHSGVEIPEDIWSTQNVACISPDISIFDLMNQAKKSCKGNLKCTFYHFFNNRHQNIGTADVDKELFHDLLAKFDNWLLTPENIKKNGTRDEETTKDVNINDVTADVSEKDSQYRKPVKLNGNLDQGHSHNVEVHLHHVRNGHESHHNKDGNSFKINPVDNLKYFEIILPKNNVTGEQKTFYVEVNAESNEFVILDEEINKELIEGKTIKIELDELSEIADQIFSDPNAKIPNHKIHNNDFVIDNNMVTHNPEHKLNHLSEFQENDNDSDIHQTDVYEQNPADTSESIIQVVENNDNDDFNDVNDTSYHDTNLNEPGLNISNKELIEGKTIKIELDEVSEIADQIFSVRDAKTPNHKIHNNDNGIDNNMVMHNREHKLNHLLGLQKNDNGTNIYQTDVYKENPADIDESIIQVVEHNDNDEFNGVDDSSYSDTNLNEAGLNIPKSIRDNKLTSTSITSILNSRESDNTGLTINLVPSTETVLHELSPVSSPTYTTVPIVGYDFAKTLKAHSHLQSSFPVYATLESSPISDSTHPTITSSYTPCDSTEFSSATSNSFSPSSIFPSPPIEYVMRLKGSQQSPFNVGFTWLPSNSRIEELRSPCMKPPLLIDEALLPQKSLLPIQSEELPFTLESLDNSIPIEKPYIPLENEIPVTSVPCHPDADLVLVPKDTVSSQISNTFDSALITPELSVISSSVIPCTTGVAPSPVPQISQSVLYFPAQDNLGFVTQLPFDTSSSNLSPMLERKEPIIPCSPYLKRYPYATVPCTANPHLVPSYLESLSPTHPLRPKTKIPAQNLPISLDQICSCTNGDNVQQTKPILPQLLAPVTLIPSLSTRTQAPVFLQNNLPYLWNNIGSTLSSPYTGLIDQTLKIGPPAFVGNSPGNLIENIVKPCLSRSVPLPCIERPYPAENVLQMLPPRYTPLQDETPLSKINKNLQSSPLKLPRSNELDSFLIGPHLNTQSPSNLDSSNSRNATNSPPVSSHIILHENSLIGPHLSTFSNMQPLESDSSYVNHLDSSLIGPHLQIGSPPVIQDMNDLSKPVPIQPDVSVMTSTNQPKNRSSILDSLLLDTPMRTVSELKPLPNDEIQTICETLSPESEFTVLTPLDLSQVKRPIQIVSPVESKEIKGTTENTLSNLVELEAEFSNFTPLDSSLIGPNLNTNDIRKLEKPPPTNTPLIPTKESDFEILEQTPDLLPIDIKRVLKLPPVKTQHKTIPLEKSILNSEIHLDNSLIGPSLIDEIPSEISTLDSSSKGSNMDHVIGSQEFTTASELESSKLSPSLQNLKESPKILSVLKPNSYIDSSLTGPSLSPMTLSNGELQPESFEPLDASLIGPSLNTASTIPQPKSFDASLIGPSLDTASTIAPSICPPDVLKLLSNPITMSQQFPFKMKPRDKLLSTMYKISPIQQDLKTSTLQDNIPSEFVPITQFYQDQKLPYKAPSNLFKSGYIPTPKTYTELLSNLRKVPCTSVSPYSSYIQKLQPFNTQQFLHETSVLKPSNVVPIDSNEVVSLTDDTTNRWNFIPEMNLPTTPSALDKYISSFSKKPSISSPKEVLGYNSEPSPIIVDDIMSLLDENSLKLLKDTSVSPIRSSLTSTIPGFATQIMNTDYSKTHSFLPGHITHSMLPSSLYGPHLSLYNSQKIPYKQKPNTLSSNFDSYFNAPLKTQFSETIGPTSEFVTLPTESLKTPTSQLNSISTEYSPASFSPTSSITSPNKQIYTPPFSVSYANPISTTTTNLLSNVRSPLTPSPLSLKPTTSSLVPEYISPYQPIISTLPDQSYSPNTALKKSLASAVPCDPIVPYSNPSLLLSKPLLAKTEPYFSKIMSELTPTEPNLYSPIYSQSVSTPINSVPMSPILESLEYSSPLELLSTSNLAPPYVSTAPLNPLAQLSNLLPSAYLTPERLNERPVPLNPALNPTLQLTPQELQLLKLMNTPSISNINPFLNSYQRPLTSTKLPIQSNSPTNQIVPCADTVESSLESPLTEELLFNNPEVITYEISYDRGDKNYETSKYSVESLPYTLVPEDIAEPLKINLLEQQESISLSPVNYLGTKPTAPVYTKALLKPSLKSLYSPTLIDNIPPKMFNNICPLQNAVGPPPSILFGPLPKPLSSSISAPNLPLLPNSGLDISESPYYSLPMNKKPLSPYYTASSQNMPLSLDLKRLKNIISPQVTLDLSLPIHAPYWIDSAPVSKPKMVPESYIPGTYIEMPATFSALKSKTSPCKTSVMPSITPLYYPFVTLKPSHISPFEIAFSGSSLKHIKPPIPPQYISSVLPVKSLENEATYQYYTPLPTTINSPVKNLRHPKVTTPYTVSPTSSSTVEPIRDLNSQLSSVTPLLPLPTLTSPTTILNPPPLSNIVTTPHISKPVITNDIIPSSLFTISDSELLTLVNKLCPDDIQKHRLPLLSLTSPLRTVPSSTILEQTAQAPISKPKSLKSFSAPLSSLPYFTQPLKPIDSYPRQPACSVPYASQSTSNLSPVSMQNTVPTSTTTTPLQKLPLRPDPILQYSLPSNPLYDTAVYPLFSVSNPFLKPDLKLYSEVPSHPVTNNLLSPPISPVENVILPNILRPIDISQKHRLPLLSLTSPLEAVPSSTILEQTAQTPVSKPKSLNSYSSLPYLTPPLEPIASYSRQPVSSVPYISQSASKLSPVPMQYTVPTSATTTTTPIQKLPLGPDPVLQYTLPSNSTYNTPVHPISLVSNPFIKPDLKLYSKVPSYSLLNNFISSPPVKSVFLSNTLRPTDTSSIISSVEFKPPSLLPLAVNKKSRQPQVNQPLLPSTNILFESPPSKPLLTASENSPLTSVNYSYVKPNILEQYLSSTMINNKQIGPNPLVSELRSTSKSVYPQKSSLGSPYKPSTMTLAKIPLYSNYDVLESTSKLPKIPVEVSAMSSADSSLLSPKYVEAKTIPYSASKVTPILKQYTAPILANSYTTSPLQKIPLGPDPVLQYNLPSYSIIRPHTHNQQTPYRLLPCKSLPTMPPLINKTAKSPQYSTKKVPLLDVPAILFHKEPQLIDSSIYTSELPQPLSNSPQYLTKRIPLKNDQVFLSNKEPQLIDSSNYCQIHPEPLFSYSSSNIKPIVTTSKMSSLQPDILSSTSYTTLVKPDFSTPSPLSSTIPTTPLPPCSSAYVKPLEYKEVIQSPSKSDISISSKIGPKPIIRPLTSPHISLQNSIPIKPYSQPQIFAKPLPLLEKPIEVTPEITLPNLLNKYRYVNKIAPTDVNARVYEPQLSIKEMPLKLGSAKQATPVNSLFKFKPCTKTIQGTISSIQGQNSNNGYDILESEMFTEILPEFKGLNVPYSNKYLPRPQRLSKQDHFYENNHIGAKPEILTVPDTLPIDSPTDITVLNDATVLKEIDKPKLNTNNLKPNDYYPAILDSLPENPAITISPPQNYLKPCLESDSQYKYTPNAIEIPDTPPTVYPCNNDKDIEYSGYKTYQIPALKSPQTALNVEPLTEINTSEVPQTAVQSLKKHQIPCHPYFDNPPKMLDLLTPKYQTQQTTDQPEYLNALQENSELSDFKTIVKEPIDNKEDNELKTSLINYINNKEVLKDNLGTDKEVTIPLGNIAVIKKEPNNADTIETNNPSIGLKVWKSKVLVAEAKLQLKIKDLAVNNFMPIVNNLNKYDVDEIKKIVKNYIDEKYGNHIEIKEPYVIDNQYTVIEDFDYNCSDNKYNLLWPTNYV